MCYILLPITLITPITPIILAHFLNFEFILCIFARLKHTYYERDGIGFGWSWLYRFAYRR